MIFVKYPRIENHYSEKYLNRAKEKIEGLIDARMIAFEKLHGANFQVTVDVHGNHKIARRTDYLGEDEKFYNIREVIESDRFKKDLEELSMLSALTGKTTRAYGELIGKRVQAGVDYGEANGIFWFDIAVGEEFLSGKEFYMFMMTRSMQMAPVVSVFDDIMTALQFDVENFMTILGPNTENNLAEGIVIRGYDRDFSAWNKETSSWSRFTIKKKHEKFRENQKKHSIKNKEEYSSEVNRLSVVFNDYFCENRLDSLFSKYGEPEGKKDIGKYVILFLEDAKEDFFKENELDLMVLTESEFKRVLKPTKNIGSMIAKRVI